MPKFEDAQNLNNPELNPSELQAGINVEKKSEIKIIPEEFDFDKLQNVFTGKDSEIKAILEKIPDSKIIAGVILNFDPFSPRLKIEFTPNIKNNAAGSYNFEDATGKEINYSINTTKEYGNNIEDKLLKLLKIGIHEIRHRTQHLDEELELISFEDLEKIIEDKKLYESFIEHLKTNDRYKPKEIDAVIFSELSGFLYKNGIKSEKIKNLIKSDKYQIIKDLKEQEVFKKYLRKDYN